MTTHQRRGRRTYRPCVPKGEELRPRSVTMTDAMWSRLDALARKADTTRSAIIRRLVSRELGDSR